MSPSIIFENTDFLIVNKPVGLAVHADGRPAQQGRTKEHTLADWLLEKYPEIKDVGEPWTSPEGEVIYRPGIVHRLDKDTSGLMVVAKNQEMFDVLKKQFQNREVKKVYHAFVYGEMKQIKGIVDRPIGRSTKDFRKKSAQRGAKGELRDAITHFKVLNRKDGLSFIEAEPKTGRTHQIRVHMKAINHPIVCDKLYAPNHECKLGFGRTALHARSLSFNDKDGQPVSFEAPYPEDFEKALTLFN
jgi:23S rRNA pseudouridine1911/1915/1917 synthase